MLAEGADASGTSDSVSACLPPVVPIRVLSGVDRYGFSSLLAERCGRRTVPRSFANWVHGWNWTDEQTAKVLNCDDLPRDVTIVVCNEAERAGLERDGFTTVRVGGLPFAYVPQQLPSRRTDALLAFPPHSAEAERQTADHGRYLDYLESLKGDFESVYVSIHYLDIGTPLHTAAAARGLHVIQGARPDDANSLLRVRAMLDLFGHVTTNVVGSHMLYALFSGCRFSFCGPMYAHDESVLLGGGNPHGHTSDFIRFIEWIQSEAYLRTKFGRFFADHPRQGLPDTVFAEAAIGLKHLMTPDQVESALGWSLEGRLLGYARAARRRARRLGLGARQGSRHHNL